MDNKQSLIGRKSINEPMEVATGIYVYEFSCEILPNVVSSYQGTHGEVIYKVTFEFNY